MKLVPLMIPWSCSMIRKLLPKAYRFKASGSNAGIGLECRASAV